MCSPDGLFALFYVRAKVQTPLFQELFHMRYLLDGSNACDSIANDIHMYLIPFQMMYFIPHMYVIPFQMMYFVRNDLLDSILNDLLDSVPDGRPGMSDVSLLSGISGLSFDSPFLSPLLFFLPSPLALSVLSFFC